MEQKYTPTPWRVCTCAAGDDPHFVTQAEPKIVFRSSGTVKMDAKICAAAPDLLAALEDIVSSSDAGCGDSLANAINAARAPIRKARGE